MGEAPVIHLVVGEEATWKRAQLRFANLVLPLSSLCDLGEATY